MITQCPKALASLGALLVMFAVSAIVSPAHGQSRVVQRDFDLTRPGVKLTRNVFNAHQRADRQDGGAYVSGQFFALMHDGARVSLSVSTGPARRLGQAYTFDCAAATTEHGAEDCGSRGVAFWFDDRLFVAVRGKIHNRISNALFMSSYDVVLIPSSHLVDVISGRKSLEDVETIHLEGTLRSEFSLECVSATSQDIEGYGGASYQKSLQAFLTPPEWCSEAVR